MSLRRIISACCILAVFTASAIASPEPAKKGADLKSVGPLAFGPGGVLLVADPWGAAVFAVETGDTKPVKGELAVEAIDRKVAALLGISASEIEIRDLAINPASGVAYLSVVRGRGPTAKPAIVTVAPGGKLALLDLGKLEVSRAELPDAPSPEAVGRRNRKLRLESITDVALADGRVLVAGLSNEKFASTLRSIPYPFSGSTKGASVEIYHGAHGKFETHSPVRTFVPFDIEGEAHLLAAYTCTPLVRLKMSDLQPGKHVKGTTVAELGNRNRPLDMIAYTKGEKKYLLLANNNRGIMKIPTAGIGAAESIEDPVARGKTHGVGYETIESWKNIHQLDRLDEERAVVIHRDDEGAYHLEVRPLP